MSRFEKSSYRIDVDDTTKDIESFVVSRVDELPAWLHLGAYSLPIPYSPCPSGFTHPGGTVLYLHSSDRIGNGSCGGRAISAAPNDCRAGDRWWRPLRQQ